MGAGGTSVAEVVAADVSVVPSVVKVTVSVACDETLVVSVTVCSSVVVDGSLEVEVEVPPSTGTTE